MAERVSWNERVAGGILGVAVGDALGVPVEGNPRDALAEDPIHDMRGGGTWGQPAGTWSDDSSLTFCLAESLIGGFDLDDQGRWFCRWLFENAWTPHGSVFDGGMTTIRALHNLRDGAVIGACGLTDEHSNGNGSIMRSVPLALWGRGLPPARLLDCTHRSSAITHAHPRAQMGCGLYVAFAARLLAGNAPSAAQRSLAAVVDEHYGAPPFAAERPHFERLLRPDFGDLTENEISSSGYVVDSLEAAVWCLLRHDNLRDVVLHAVNLGGDTDTTGAVAGGLAGVLYGRVAVPAAWVNALASRERIEDLIVRFTAAVEKPEVA